MKLIFTSILICLTLSSCVTHIPQSNVYQQAAQSEIDESELQQLLNLSKQELEQHKANYIRLYSTEGWSEWKKTINLIKGSQEPDYWKELSSIIRMGLGGETEIGASEKEELLQTSTTSATTGASELKKELDQAQELLDEGLITKEEYEAQRKKILSNYY